MEEKQNNNMSWWLEEMVEQSKANAKRWFIAWIITLAALFCTNAYWIYQFTSYNYVSQDGSGVNSINTGQQEEVNIGTENEDQETWQE